MIRRLLFVLPALAAVALPAAQEVSLEYQVKTAYLYNFVKYIEWPEPVRAPLLICVAGQNPFGTVLEDLIRNQSVRGVPLRTEVVPGPIPECNVIFTPRTSKVPAYLKAAAGTPTLTVGETDGFIELGGMIRFFVDGGKNVRFEINRTAAERAKLRISSRLLQLARLAEPGADER
jgi:hypothetical protein